MKFDLHLHTRRYSPDSSIDPLHLVQRARAVGLDGIVITEHDCPWPERELDELRRAAKGLIVLAGMEISAWEGDVLVYGFTDAERLTRGLGWAELCAEVHRQGGVAVMAHPYRWGKDVDRHLRETKAQFDGLELMSSNMDAELRRKTATLHARWPKLAGLGNSDAHSDETIGRCRTVFSVPVRTNAELVAAIRAGQTRAEDAQA